MIGMNMPLLQDGTVEFTATLFALVRTSLDINMPQGINAVSEMNKQLKVEICRTFPGMRSKLLERVLPVDGWFYLPVSTYQLSHLINCHPI